jgi:hypothetical protein
MDKKTFCAAPWFQVRTSSSGELTSCCVMRTNKTSFAGKTNYRWPENTVEDWLNSDYLQYVRQALNNGEQIPECDLCWIKEKYNQTSLRQIINDYFTNKEKNIDWLDYYFSKKTDYNSELLVSADIKLDNTCNFACIMCIPEDSSKIWHIWNNNQDNKFVKAGLDQNPNRLEDIKLIYREKDNYRLLQNIVLQRPKLLKILGGEPLLDKKMFKILEQVPLDISKKINLNFVTNGSVNLSESAERLSHFKSVTFGVSLEGIGDVQDYLRRGSDWQSIEQNILSYQGHVYIAYTLQALSVYYAHELFAWCNKNNMPINFGILKNPAYLSLDAIPTDLKQTIYDNLKQAKIEFVKDLDNDVTQESKTLADLILNSSYKPELLADLREFVNWYDPNGKHSQIFPEWQPYFSKI